MAAMNSKNMSQKIASHNPPPPPGLAFSRSHAWALNWNSAGLKKKTNGKSSGAAAKK